MGLRDLRGVATRGTVLHAHVDCAVSECDSSQTYEFCQKMRLSVSEKRTCSTCISSRLYVVGVYQRRSRGAKIRYHAHSRRRAVFNARHNLRHLAFFEELTRYSETDKGWHAATAGLVVLRLVDSWLEDCEVVKAGAFGTKAVRQAI